VSRQKNIFSGDFFKCISSENVLFIPINKSQQAKSAAPLKPAQKRTF
jgi:hypothetical protein